MDDAALVQAARGGDRVAFAEIYDRYVDRIHDFCTSMLRDRHEAADAMQDTFLMAGERLHQLREPSKLRSWLFAIARHEALRRVEARKRVAPTEEITDMAADDGAVDAGTREQEMRAVVAAAGEGLAERDRAVLELHLRHGLEGGELGDALGITENNAWVLMHRIRDRFERSLGALLVARQGRDACAELGAVLEEWDGVFSPLVRKRVARHVEQCEVCSETKRRLASPAALLAAVPLVPAPAEARQLVLDRVQLCSAARLATGWSDDGFPPGIGSPRGGRRRRLVAAVLALLLLGGSGGFVWAFAGGSDAGESEPIVGVTATSVVTATSTTTSSTTTTTTVAGPPPRRRAPAAPAAPPAPAPPTEAVTPQATPLPETAPPATTTTTAPPATTTTTAPPATTTTTAPPHTTTTTTCNPATGVGCPVPQ